MYPITSVMEPQLRRALHTHGLLGIVGYIDPRDFFTSADLVQKLTKSWHYVASICFRRVEVSANCPNEPPSVRETFENVTIDADHQEAAGAHWPTSLVGDDSRTAQGSTHDASESQGRAAHSTLPALGPASSAKQKFVILCLGFHSFC